MIRPVRWTISEDELRSDSECVIQAIAEGTTLVVTRNGVAVAELRPISKTRRTFVPRDELVRVAARGSRSDARQFRADLDQIVSQDLPTSSG